jgi:leucyl aminopeptidase
MKVEVVTLAAHEIEADVMAVAVPSLGSEHPRLPARVAAIDRALGGRLAAIVAAGDFRGEKGDNAVAYPEGALPAKRVMLAGLGPEAKLDANALREFAGTVARAAAGRRSQSLAIVVPRLRRVRAIAAAQALAEGAVLASYRFDRYKKPGDDKTALDTVSLVIDGAELRAARAAAAAGVTLAECQNLARELSNEPPNVLTPATLAERAEQVAKEVGLRVRVMDEAELARRKFGALLAVAQGSANRPRVIVLEHNAPAKGARKRARAKRTVCLVGKGVCFDSGGLSLKPAANMSKMKHDMSGGAAVIGALRAAALLKLPLHVVGVVGAVENMPSGTAYRPDDIVTSASGQTIEIANTDAEGRLVLADCLHFARTEFEPEAIVDLATLTGACLVALGTWSAAVLGNDQRLADAVIAAGEATGERYWQLPLWDLHKEHMRGTVADVKQTGGRDGGTITASAFLWHFVGDTPWAHLDIAPMADTEKTNAIQAYGATGFGVRSMAELLRRLARGARA